MKKILIITLTLISISAYSQKAFTLKVEAAPSIPDTTFKHPPTGLFLRFEGLNETLDSCILSFETWSDREVDSTVFLEWRQSTRGRVKLPYNVVMNAFTNGKPKPAAWNQILSTAFKMRLKPE